MFDNFKKLRTPYKHKNNFMKTLSHLILIFYSKNQWVEKTVTINYCLKKKTIWMLDFTKVLINIHEFNLYYPILYNHEEAYENKKLLHYLESWLFIHVRPQKSKTFFFSNMHIEWNMIACFSKDDFFYDQDT